MFDKFLRRGRDAPDARAKKPTADDFTGGAISGAVLKDALTHPATIYPAALSILSVAWSMMINPSPASVAAAVGFLVVSGGSIVYNYVVKGPQKAVERVAELRVARREAEVSELAQLAKRCTEAGFVEGAREAQDLTTVYQSLIAYLSGQAQNEASIDSFRVLADDTFKQGMQTLTQALATYKAIGTIDKRKLDSELRSWRSQLDLMGEKAHGRATLEAQIGNNEQRLELLEESRSKLELLIAQVNEIETALQSTYLELVALGSQDPREFLSADGGAVNRLKAAVTATRRVHERLHGDTSAAYAEKRNKYVQAAMEAESANREHDSSPSDRESERKGKE
jgi:hypothetical protein